MAGNDALRSTCGLPVIDENITQIRHGHLTFPSLGKLGFSKGTLQQIYLGCDPMLCGHLAEKIDHSTSESGLETLSNRFLENILEEMKWDLSTCTAVECAVLVFGFKRRLVNFI